jgi:SAM-dependent methyltransferase
MGRRGFHWVSSVDPALQSRLSCLSAAMAEFYSMPATRHAYQEMIDSEAAAQPSTERALCDAVLLAKPSRVLEVGCGSGRIYARMKELGLKARYTGVEMSGEVIAANTRRFPDANWICGDGYNLPVAPESQDCAFAYYVLEHCVYPRRFLESMLLAIKPGGSIFLIFPDMIASGLFGSQTLGWDDRAAKSHLREGRILHALIRLLDSRVRLPLALRRASWRRGRFLVNLRPRCLEPPFDFQPDVDAVYLASGREVREWARLKGCLVYFLTLGDEFKTNVFMQIIRPSS